MQHLVYHPRAEEIIETFQASVGEQLIETVFAYREKLELPVNVKASSVDQVAPGAVMFCLPLYFEVFLVALYVEYENKPVIFMVMQQEPALKTLDDDEISRAQNFLYECQAHIDRA